MNTNKVHQDFKTSQWKLETPYLSKQRKTSQHYVFNSLLKDGMFRQEETVYTLPTPPQVSRKSHISHVAHWIQHCLSKNERANSINCFKKNYLPYKNEVLSQRYKEENSLLIHNTLKKMELFEEQEQVLWKMLLRYEI